MRKITEVLRLDAQGLSQRQIALSTAMSKTAVRDYLFRAERAGLCWPLPEAMTAEALEATLFPPPVVLPAAERPVPDWRVIHKELKRKDCHVTLRLVAGVERVQSRRLALQPVLLPLQPLVGRHRRGHAPVVCRWGADVRRFQRRQGPGVGRPGQRRGSPRRSVRLGSGRVGDDLRRGLWVPRAWSAG